MVRFCFLRYRKQERLDRILPKIPEATVPGMVGTMCLSVDFFLTKFRARRFIEIQQLRRCGRPSKRKKDPIIF